MLSFTPRPIEDLDAPPSMEEHIGLTIFIVVLLLGSLAAAFGKC